MSVQLHVQLRIVPGMAQKDPLMQAVSTKREVLVKG